jgi:hypothetical protein
MKRAFLIGAVVVLVVLLFPRPVVVAPEWEIAARDEAGTPVAEVEVTETWNHYPFRDGKYATLMTDEHGVAKFPERRMWVPLLETGAGKLMNLLPHGSGGPMASVYVRKDGYSTFSAANYEQGIWTGKDTKPMRSQWTLYACGKLSPEECSRTFFPNKEARR